MEATSRVRRVLRQPFDVDARDRVAQQLHDAGHYWAALLVKDSIRRWYADQRAPDPRDVATTIEYMLASSAGIVLPPGTRSRLLPKTLPSDRAVLHYQLANIAANKQSWVRAKQHLARAADIAGASAAKRQALFPVHQIRSAQVLRDPKAVAQALSACVPHSYSYHTALVLAGWIAFESEKMSAAQDCFEQLFDEPNLSWLYRAEGWCGLACIKMRTRRDIGGAFKLIARSQYIVAMLGQLPIAHAEIRLESAVIPWSGFPGELLLCFSPFRRYARRECTSLRREAIIDSGLQSEIFQFLGA